ncbi:MAG: hypothetical protein WCH99_10250 [Verrucomicrobiota bacterium]
MENGAKISVVPRHGKGVKAKLTFTNLRFVETGFNRGMSGLDNAFAELEQMLVNLEEKKQWNQIVEPVFKNLVCKPILP